MSVDISIFAEKMLTLHSVDLNEQQKLLYK